MCERTYTSLQKICKAHNPKQYVICRWWWSWLWLFLLCVCSCVSSTLFSYVIWYRIWASPHLTHIPAHTISITNCLYSLQCMFVCVWKDNVKVLLAYYWVWYWYAWDHIHNDMHAHLVWNCKILWCNSLLYFTLTCIEIPSCQYFCNPIIDTNSNWFHRRYRIKLYLKL